ncbi:restriction endonuclease subunit S [Streptomyces mirabilis]
MSNSTWTLVPLAECVTSVRAGVSVNSEDRPHAAGEVGVLKTSSVSGGVFKANEHKAVLAGDRLRVAEPVLGGSVLFSRMNTPLLVGEACYVESDHPSLFLPDRLWQIRTEPSRVDARWLAYVLQSTGVSYAIKALATGTSGSMKNIAKRSLLASNILLPPIAEQRRIAEILGALDDQLRVAGQIVNKLRTAKNALRSALYCDESGVNWNRDWPLMALRSVVTRIDAGKSPDCPDIPASSGQWGVLKVSAVGRDHLHPMENKVIPSHVHVDPSSEVRAGDILMTRANTPDLVGMICLADRSFDGHLVLSDKTWRINLGKSLDPSFVVEMLRASPSRRYIQNVATGTSGSMKNFSQMALLKMPVPVPDQSVQQRTAEYLSEMTTRIDAEEEAINKLRMAKEGVLSDLLSGRIRVPPESLS